MHLSKIDDSTRGEHFHLQGDDECYYFLEYTSGKDYSFSKANSLISNLKKKPSNNQRPDYKYKIQDIGRVSIAFQRALNPVWLKSATLVPVPGSKARSHPDYDDRMEKICQGIGSGIDVRNLVVQKDSTIASHEATACQRVTVEELLELYEVDESLVDPRPTCIAVFDDVLTAGVHFRAMKIALNERFPGVRVVGMFIARRIFPQE